MMVVSSGDDVSRDGGFDSVVVALVEGIFLVAMMLIGDSDCGS